MQDTIWKKIKEVADRLKVNETTFRVWKSRGAVPGNWHLPLLEASHGSIKLADLKRLASAAAEKKRRRIA